MVVDTEEKQKEDEQKRIKKQKKNKTDSDSDSDDEIAEEKEMKYINPLEVKDHIVRLWEKDSEILDIVFGNVFPNKETGFEIQSTGFEIFFIENLIVSSILKF